MKLIFLMLKLLYTNKLFKAHSLNEDQKLKVVESFDLTKNVREAKLVYATLGESFQLKQLRNQNLLLRRKEKEKKPTNRRNCIQGNQINKTFQEDFI